jgi:cyclophilin family peptidyl-prolyl cis-trans isomerase
MKIEKLCINCMQERRSPDGICEFCGFDVRTFELPRHHMRPFTILAGKYLIGNAIGEGGFGITYIGMDLNLEVKVAIKEYYPQGAAVRDCRTNDSTVWSYSKSTQVFFEEGREKFINEAKTIAKFRNVPEIVGVIDFFRENQTAYIVMEYLDGQTLKQYLKVKGGKIPADELLRMMKPLIASLGKLHAQGLIHRDISPDNIMIMKDGSIKILDFGGARDFVSQNGKSMSVLVKHGYAPEEQYRSRGDQGPWTDVYALCATMYRCITGKIPPEALDRLYEDELKPISSFGVNCPKCIEQAITKGLSVRKDGRYQSMEELYDALYKGKPPKPPKPPKPKNNKTKLIIAAVATAAVGIAVIAGVGIKMKQPDEKVVAKEVVTPTPEPTSTPETKNSDEEIVQTASGVNIIKQNATYYAMASVNVRSDCNAKDNIIGEVEKGQELTSTGVSQDGEWIEIKYNGQTGYIFASLVDTTKPTETTETKQSTSDTIDRAYVLDTSKELTGIHHAEIDIKNYGHIEVELDADTAPITVKNFVKLAQEGFYDGVTFWRIMDGFMIQGGDPTRTGKGGSDETIKGEFGSNGVENAISHTRGTISMARSSDPDSASSQFFIVQSDSTFLDGDYAAFGHVTEGMDVVDQICKDANPTDNNGTIKADEQPVIESIQIKD